MEEICSALSNKNELSYQDYANLKYLENVLRETLRMYTTVPLISRQVEEDVVLPSKLLILFKYELKVYCSFSSPQKKRLRPLKLHISIDS